MSNGAIYRKKIRRWYSETIKWRGGHFAPSVHFAPRYQGRPKKWGQTGTLCLKAYNFKNNEQIFAKFGINQSHFILNTTLYFNRLWKILAPTSE